MKQSRNEPSANARDAKSTPVRAWKKVLGALGGPLVRLHHYRDVRTRVLHDAMFMSERQRCNMNPDDCASTRR